LVRIQWWSTRQGNKLLGQGEFDGKTISSPYIRASAASRLPPQFETQRGQDADCRAWSRYCMGYLCIQAEVARFILSNEREHLGKEPQLERLPRPEHHRAKTATRGAH